MSERLRAAQISARDAMLEKVVHELESNHDVAALWLAGSLAGTSDALSDIDLIVVAMEGCEPQLQKSVSALMPELGDLVLEHSAPQNAPLGGAHINALYDVQPLPLLIDWNVWPSARTRPCDVAVLFEREGLDIIDGPTFSEIQVSQEHGRAHRSSPARKRSFTLMMIPIIAKYAARGRFEQIRSLFSLIGVTFVGEPGLGSVLKSLEGVLDEATLPEGHPAEVCVRRYLDSLEVFTRAC